MKTQIAGYQGFQSYSNLPYPSLKSGKDKLAPNDLWERTERPQDKQDFTDNFHYKKTIYNQTQNQNLKPEDFKNHEHVKKGNYQFSQTGTQTLSSLGAQNENLLKTGTEHWKSNYKAGIVDPYKIQKAERPQWTKYQPPYQVNAPVGQSENKTQYGGLGFNPRERLDNEGSLKVNKLEDNLKMGTTQCTFHIPGYTGFIPSVKTAGEAIKQGQGTQIHQPDRTQVLETFKSYVPGYSGHKPSSIRNQRGTIREHCFSTESQLKY